MSSESSKQTQKAPALEFRGGVYTSLVPFLLFVLGSFGLAIFNVATVEGFWLVAIACIIIGMWLCKDSLKYFDEICRGTASPLLTTAVFCWLWSGLDLTPVSPVVCSSVSPSLFPAFTLLQREQDPVQLPP